MMGAALDEWFDGSTAGRRSLAVRERAARSSRRSLIHAVRPSRKRCCGNQSLQQKMRAASSRNKAAAEITRARRRATHRVRRACGARARAARRRAARSRAAAPRRGSGPPERVSGGRRLRGVAAYSRRFRPTAARSHEVVRKVSAATKLGEPVDGARRSPSPSSCSPPGRSRRAIHVIGSERRRVGSDAGARSPGPGVGRRAPRTPLATRAQRLPRTTSFAWLGTTRPSRRARPPAGCRALRERLGGIRDGLEAACARPARRPARRRRARRLPSGGSPASGR